MLNLTRHVECFTTKALWLDLKYQWGVLRQSIAQIPRWVKLVLIVISMLYSKTESQTIAFLCVFVCLHRYGGTDNAPITSYWLSIRLIQLQVNQGGCGRLLLLTRDYRGWTCALLPVSHLLPLTFLIFDKAKHLNWAWR